MGLYDTAQQGKLNPLQGAVGNGGSFAQKSPVANNYAAKQQMRANPVMQGRPAMSGGNAWQANRAQKPNTGLVNSVPMPQPGRGGSQSMIQAKQLAQQNKTNAATGGPIGGSYGQMVSSNPQLEQYRNTGREHGQDMSWMDQPGALAMGPSSPSNPSNQAQSGLAPLQTPYEQQIQASKPNAVMGAAQSSLSNSMNPMQAAQEQMRGYEGPDLGSRDPRELARMGQMGPLQGSVGQPSLNAPPFGGEQPGSNGFQSMLQNMGGQRPDVMPRGIGPSVVMDENGLEPRRGAR